MLISSLSDGADVPRLRSKSTKELASILKKQPAVFARNRSHSTNSLNKKNVRFSAHLTEIKKYDKFAEPITISNEASPELSPLLVPLDHASDENDGCWFRDLRLLPALINIEKGFDEFRLGGNGAASKQQQRRRPGSKLFSLEDNDSDDELDYYLSEAGTLVGPRTGATAPVPNYTFSPSPMLSPTSQQPLSLDVKWDVLSTNIINSNLILNDDVIRHFMHNPNIRVQSLRMDSGGSKLVGYLIVSNLAFEKYIEVKFTFNGWENIHYVNAAYLKTVSQHYDQFKFVIDVRSFKFFLNLKNLLVGDRLNIELCCRYDVRHETYYDNNNYNNYKVVLTRPSPVVEMAPLRAQAPTERPKAVASAAQRHHTRTFSADTDFFNTSPLKDMYRNSMSNISAGAAGDKGRRPKRPNSTIGLNLVAEQHGRAHTQPPLSERVMHFNSDLSSISSESMSSAASSASTDSTASSSLYSFQSDNRNSSAATTNPAATAASHEVVPLAKQPTPMPQQSPPQPQLNLGPAMTLPEAPTISLDTHSLTLDCINDFLSPSLADIKDQLYLSPSRNSAAGKNTNDNITITSTPESVATDTTLGRNVPRIPQDTITPTNKPTVVGSAKGPARETNTQRKPQLSPLSSLDADYQTLLDSCCFYTPPTLTPNERPSNHLTFMSSMAE